MNILIQTLYGISTALLVPVVLCLLGLLAWTLLAVGGFTREALERRRWSVRRGELFGWLQGVGEPPDAGTLEGNLRDGEWPALLAAFALGARTRHGRPRELCKLTDEIEIDAASRVSRLGLGARIGPMLGLMGTLIPLGPALIGLSSGRLEILASNLVVAFATTVVGLLGGGLCYAMLHFRRQWYALDLSDIEYIRECLQAGGNDSK